MRVGLKCAFALLLCGALLGYSVQFVPIEEHGNAARQGAPAGEIELYFCPGDDCAERLVEFIGSAGESVHVMVYSFTKAEIAEALVDAGGRGVDVRVVMDKTQAAGAYSKDEFLTDGGIPVRLVDPSGYGVMHHKVTVIDRNAFSTGSYNYTENASYRNAENLVVVRDRELALEMEAEFEGLWAG